ncbi:hypothetical protein DJ021_14185 [Phenylobacterium hankyongense]|uniref:Uncharacterized protein n=1 Tax=Phenylobacterium hankyongense TaxID=1813876 RepID=A0A328B777_9CAUL|nr:hypothetical protein [Phenylobacterium hankyongense]RAK60878.1 hypothetical protein DJ021_14185 [Phenylobacterium hankyongense]
MPYDDDAMTNWFRRRTVDIAADKAQRAYQAWQALSAPANGADQAIAAGAGGDTLVGSDGADKLARPYPKLRGRPGVEATIAGVANAITAQPNSHATYPSPMGTIRVTRGLGDGVRAQAPGIAASGQLAPPSDRAQVEVDNIRKSGFLPGSLPDRARLFTTPDGRLMYEIHPGAKIFGFAVPEGVHPVGP